MFYRTFTHFRACRGPPNSILAGEDQLLDREGRKLHTFGLRNPLFQPAQAYFESFEPCRTCFGTSSSQVYEP